MCVFLIRWCTSVNLLFQSIPLFQSFPFGNHESIFYVYFVNKFICLIFQIPHISDIISYFSFSVGLASLSVIISRSIYVAAYGIISYVLWLSSIPLYTYTTSFLSRHLLMDTWVASHALAFVSSAAMNTGVQVTFQITAFFPRYMSWIGIPESYDNSIFSFLRCLHTAFHSG